MGKCKQLKSGRWNLRSYVGKDSTGKKIYHSFTCDTPAQCYKEEKKWLRAGGDIIVEERPKGPTVDDVVHEYIEACRTNTRREFSPTTLKMYESTRRNGFPILSNLEAQTITTDDVQDMIDARAAARKAPKTIKNALYLLKPALDRVGKKDIAWTQLEIPDEEPEDYIIPTDEQIQALLDDTADRDPDLHHAIVFGAFCGCRRSEICALEYGDINGMTLSITKALVINESNEYTEKETKTRAGRREINLSPEILEALDLNSVVAHLPHCRIVQTNPDALSKRFGRLRDRLGFEFCFHSLRHYHASVMVALDVPIKYIVGQMGHATDEMVRKVYAQAIREKEQSVADAVNSHTAAVLGHSKFEW